MSRSKKKFEIVGTILVSLMIGTCVVAWRQETEVAKASVQLLSFKWWEDDEGVWVHVPNKVLDEVDIGGFLR